MSWRRRAPGIAFLLVPIWTIGTASSVANAADLPWPDAYVPVVECSVRVPSDFKRTDPVVIVTYSNTSDRCPAYELVAIDPTDRLVLGPDISFDRTTATKLAPDLSYAPEGKLEIPPLTAVSVTYRVGDMYRVPSVWSRMWVSPASANGLNRRWCEFDPTGKEIGTGVDREYPYEKELLSQWRVTEIRERIRADIRRYAEMKSNDLPMSPRIGRSYSPTGLAKSGGVGADRQQHDTLRSAARP